MLGARISVTSNDSFVLQHNSRSQIVLHVSGFLQRFQIDAQLVAKRGAIVKCDRLANERVETTVERKRPARERRRKKAHANVEDDKSSEEIPPIHKKLTNRSRDHIA